ncbi:MAG TPA: hypothetical protein VIM17_06915 [Jatrophihabitantaceae bacterium]
MSPQPDVERAMSSDDLHTEPPTTSLLLRTTPPAVWLLVALTGAIAILSAVFYPNFRGPDETDHTDLVVAVAQRSVDWQPGTLHVQLGVLRAPLSSVRRLHGSQYLGKNSMPPRGERPSYLALGGDRPTKSVNYLVQHPPLYYIVLGSALSVVPHWRTMPFDRIVLYLRLLGVLMFMPVPWFCYAAARTLSSGRGVWIAAAATPLMSPQLLHISATVNNDVPVTLLGAMSIWLAARVLHGDLGRRTAFQLGLLSAAVSLTKGFGLVVAFLVVCVYLIAFLRYRRPQGLLRPFLRCAAWFLPPVLVASTWWIGNYAQYHRLQPNGLRLPAAQRNVAPPRTSTTFAKSGWKFMQNWLDDFTQRFWFDDPAGNQRDRPLHLLALVLTVAVIVLVVALLIRPRLERPFVLLVVACVVITGAQLMRLAWPTYRAIFFVGAAQGRYLFALSAGIGLLIAFGLDVVLRGSERWVPRVAVTAAVLINLVAARDTARWYWLPKPGTPNRAWHALQNLLYVSSMPPWLVVPLIVVVTLFTVAALWAVWAPGRPKRWFGRRQPATESPEPRSADAPQSQPALA